MYAIQLTRTLSEKSDPLVISAFFGPAGVALYQPGGKLSTLIRPVVLAMADQMYPLTTIVPTGMGSRLFTALLNITCRII